MKKSKLWKTLIVVDQLFAVWIFNANEDQTISGHVGYKALTYKQKRYIIAERFINWLFSPWEKDHCRNSIEWDRINEQK